ncbi:hypothetical protein SAMN02745857_03068 [Andreprevotia lacus DSM 23236]|jgi:hypothetical protein|uniref:Uncharacterized protein n=1 Tax=Andreprevotia lacus DSM 23236 TaxID=1121001 RepID=A0A1W1XVN9_9NEIS|nr:hypothetical protein [Andreprevotia lacus]SMC28029.1 hypothetical protein SAMN02745857_03068 [Andreprevotia lacus DSM 23236]
MAKSQLRSHREAKKPKKVKVPAAPAVGATPPAFQTVKGSDMGKHRH